MSTKHSFVMVSKLPFSLDKLFEASLPRGIEKVTGLISSLFSLQNRAIETLISNFVNTGSPERFRLQIICSNGIYLASCCGRNTNTHDSLVLAFVWSVLLIVQAN